MKNLFENYTNKFGITKTIRMGLQPVPETEKIISQNGILEIDKKRAEYYKVVKSIIDRKHKSFIEINLNNFKLDDTLKEFYELYRITNKNDTEIKSIKSCEENLRKQIANHFKSNAKFDRLFKKELIEEDIWDFAETDYEKDAISAFCNGFTTYFINFNTNRKNMYSAEEKATAISFRIVNQNLPKFIDNIIAFEKIENSDLSNDFGELTNEFSDLLGFSDIKDVFNIDFYNFTLSQSGISRYNNLIGGYSNTDGTKVKGFNEYINLFNQQNKDKQKLPLLKPLFKQILSDRESLSFITEDFKNDNEVLKEINNSFNKEFFEELSDLKDIFVNFETYDINHIYFRNGLDLTSLSNGAFGSWSVIGDALNVDYDNNSNAKNKNTEKYIENRKKAIKAIKSFSIGYLVELTNDNENLIINYLKNNTFEILKRIDESFTQLKGLLSETYPDNKKLANDEQSCKMIKSLLDSVIGLKNFIKPLLGNKNEPDKDSVFYGKFEECYQTIDDITLLYNKTRNYLTKKPYSTEKIKLNFNNQELLNGWDRNKETAYLSILLLKDDDYYLAIMDKNYNKAFKTLPPVESDGPCYKKLNYKLLPGPNKMLPKVFFSNKRINDFNPSSQILGIRQKESFKKGDNFNIDDCHKLIDFFKASIDKHEEWKNFNFNFSDTSSYQDISAFYREVEHQGYKITYSDVPEEYINNLVKEGKLYLFKIYNKDFSKNSKGTPNLHTLYFKMLFDERNLKDVVFKLNGGAEMFYRKASINENDIIIHPKNQPINNKNEQNNKRVSTFNYDIIKDRRYTVDKFQLNIPITINFNAIGQGYINEDVLHDLKESEDFHIIGIDRGERNLIYITVIDSNGKIIKQISLNKIINNYNKNTYETDYHKLLDSKEDERLKARQEWKTIENIKELKEGYLSQVVHKIVQLMIDYNAIVVLEDLESGMKNNRIKVEKQIYQKFENALINKLKFCVDKTLPAEAEGGLLKAYQLVNSDSVKGRQNGFIFYIPPWNTSKIDPATGFVSLFSFKKYTSKEAIFDFISKFDKISYNKEKDYFELEFDYHKFGDRCLSDYRRYWTVCTIGERIRTFRNKEKSNEWDNEVICLTDKFKELFDKYNINIDCENLIKEIEDKKDSLNSDFFNEFIKYFKLTVQLRNSKTGSTNPEDDYLISPVANKNGEFYDSRNYIGENAVLPKDADANGAYNIARKGLYVVEQIKSVKTDEELKKVKINMSNKEWLEYAQKQDM